MNDEANANYFTPSHAGSCPHCQYMFPPLWDAAPEYFDNGYITCGECKKQTDLWDVVLRRTLAMGALSMSLVSLGATDWRFSREIEANKYHEILLTDLGIPEDATILQVGYSPHGGPNGIVFPIEVHGNVPQRRRIGNVLRLLGQAVTEGDGTVGTKNPVGIWVVWVHHEKHDSWPYIVQAFQEFIDTHWNRIIVPAQSAVEISLMPLIRELFERHTSPKNVKGFIGDRLTFSNAVDVVLPFMSGQAGIPKLPEPIRSSLSKLRGLRNHIAHHGTGGKQISQKEAAEGLCAAVFAFEYLRYVRPKLLAWLR